MATMKRCRAQITMSGRWGIEDLQPGMEVDLDRVLAPAVPAREAVGTPGTDGYVPAAAGLRVVTVRDAVAGKEDHWFEDVHPTAEAEG